MTAATINPGWIGFLIPNLGMPELMIIFLIAVLIFGGKKIPELAKGLGQGIRQFKNSLSAEEDETAEAKKAKEAKSST